MSVQNSSSHYAIRDDNGEPKNAEVVIYTLKTKVPKNWTNDGTSVNTYIPIAEIEKFIAQHGGIKKFYRYEDNSGW
jgi:hypothetical protein